MNKFSFIQVSTLLLTLGVGLAALAQNTVFSRPLDMAPHSISSSGFTHSYSLVNSQGNFVRIRLLNGEIKIFTVQVTVNGTTQTVFNGEQVLSSRAPNLILPLQASLTVSRIQVRAQGTDLDQVNTFAVELLESMQTLVSASPSPQPQPPSNGNVPLTCQIDQVQSQLNACQADLQVNERQIAEQYSRQNSIQTQVETGRQWARQGELCESQLNQAEQNIQILREQMPSNRFFSPQEREIQRTLSQRLSALGTPDTLWSCNMVDRHGRTSSGQGSTQGRALENLLRRNCTEANCGKRRFNENRIQCFVVR